MNPADLPTAWSTHFGLALAPLFEQSEVDNSECHYVLLDGGFGTFALSVAEDEIWRETSVAAWAWSSDSPHHVTVTESSVAVVRWDLPSDARVFKRSSVDRKLDDFYRFLSTDRIRSTKTVVEHLLSLFRRIRSLSFGAGISDDRATDVFLAALAHLIEPSTAEHSIEKLGVAADAHELYQRLDPTAVSSAMADIKRATGSLALLELHPELAIRHAGGQLFQEAHFELLRAPPTDLFSHVGDPEIKEIGRGGAHFTPPALARTVVEQAFACIDDLSTRKQITICDPACGSGAFLHEALRALRRLGFAGRLTIVGQDVSKPALAMARFVLNSALRSWIPDSGVQLDLRIADSLAPNAIPRSDVIVMNPPFISWGAQTPEQRLQLLDAMAGDRSSRGDLRVRLRIDQCVMRRTRRLPIAA